MFTSLPKERGETMSTRSDADCSAMESQLLHQYKCQANLLVFKQAKTSTLWQFSQPVIMHLWLNTSPPMVSSKELNMNMMKSQNLAANLEDLERVEEHAELYHEKTSNQPNNKQKRWFWKPQQKKVFHYYKSWKKNKNFIKSNNTVLGCIQHKRVTLYK